MLIKKNHLLLIFILFSLFLAGCNGKDETTAQTDINEIINKMDQESDYSFAGSTSVTMSQTELEDVVRFNGFINNKENLYLDLNIASIEGMPEEKMEFAKLNERMMVKYSYEDAWNEVAEEESGIYIELNNWNPNYIIETIKDSTVSAKAIEGKDGNNGVHIEVDPEKIKEQIEKQLNMQLEDGGLTEEEITYLKETMGLTDEEIIDYEKELEQQLEETRLQIDEIMKTMSVESTYELYYDPENLLIKELSQKTTTNYQLMGEKVEELTTVNMKFSDYGNKRELPEF